MWGALRRVLILSPLSTAPGWQTHSHTGQSQATPHGTVPMARQALFSLLGASIQAADAQVAAPPHGPAGSGAASVDERSQLHLAPWVGTKAMWLSGTKRERCSRALMGPTHPTPPNPKPVTPRGQSQTSLGALECTEMLRPQRRSQGSQSMRKRMEVTARRWQSWDQPWSVGQGTARAAERASPLTSAPNTWEKVKVEPTQPARLQTPPGSVQLPVSLDPQVWHVHNAPSSSIHRESRPDPSANTPGSLLSSPRR